MSSGKFVVFKIGDQTLYVPYDDLSPSEIRNLMRSNRQMVEEESVQPVKRNRKPKTRKNVKPKTPKLPNPISSAPKPEPKPEPKSEPKPALKPKSAPKPKPAPRLEYGPLCSLYPCRMIDCEECHQVKVPYIEDHWGFHLCEHCRDKGIDNH